MKRFPIDREDYLLFLVVIPVFILGGILYFIVKPKDEEIILYPPTVNIKEPYEKKLIINEVSIYPVEAVELKNTSDMDINLSGYTISDKSGQEMKLDGVIKKKGFKVLQNMDFHINNMDEVLYLAFEKKIIDTFKVDKLLENISCGITNGEKYYYQNITLGKENTNQVYYGYSEPPVFDINGGYAQKGDKISLSNIDGSTIYYTTDGSFPTSKSKVYKEPIEIKQNTVIKAVSIKTGYLPSDIVSRTFITDRKHDMAFISLSTNNLNFYTVYSSSKEQKASFEFYESNGDYGISFLSDIQVSGRSSSLLPQKSIAIFLRKKYGLNKVTYSFFKENNYNTYSSFTLRNGGTDPTRVHIKDAILTQIIDGEMDIDMQNYRPVAVYLNGKYYGLYSLREKLNGDYLESKYGIDKDNVDIIKRGEVIKGNNKAYQEIMNYIKKNNVKNDEVYKVIEEKIDIQELINYWIVESFYNNSDFFKRNIGLWKGENTKWRFLLFDLDYALEDYETKPTLFLNQKPSYNNDMKIIVLLYQNNSFKDLYLKSLAKYLKTTFKPERMNKIIDDMMSEVEKEIPYHIKRWASGYEYPYGWDYFGSVNAWKSNIKTLKSKLNNRYNEVIKSLKNFNLSKEDYEKYFGGLK